MRRWARALATGALVGLAGCSDGAPGFASPTDPGGSGTPGDPRSFSAGVQPILTQSCAFSACHAGASPQMGMNLSQGNAHANLVGVPSRQQPAMLRVRPSDPGASYLLHKLEGTAGSVGGIGTRMPLGGQLTAAEIQVIRAWVQAGAPNN